MEEGDGEGEGGGRKGEGREEDVKVGRGWYIPPWGGKVDRFKLNTIKLNPVPVFNSGEVSGKWKNRREDPRWRSERACLLNPRIETATAFPPPINRALLGEERGGGRLKSSCSSPTDEGSGTSGIRVGLGRGVERGGEWRGGWRGGGG